MDRKTQIITDALLFRITELEDQVNYQDQKINVLLEKYNSSTEKSIEYVKEREAALIKLNAAQKEIEELKKPKHKCEKCNVVESFMAENKRLEEENARLQNRNSELVLAEMAAK